MIYTNLTKLAMKIAYETHKDQKDKSGIPYIYHPIHLAEQMDDEISTCVALLHDVVEDTDTTFQDLLDFGFIEEIVDVLKLLTHNVNDEYMEYIRRIKTNSTAIKVKLADLRHNSDLTRLDVVDDKAIKRVEKYENAIRILTEA